ncbi:non-ribosomal peptide synthetase [Pseudoalteromonas rubra]|uniref:Carrier domain-containing protein n=1 Tax=Pseudoalteromonas rubra TaxID=43658 RepID=A0A0F4QG74_9GAMM|nr:amino acid adenylation domain-containing protein [Pseudoalteromonas rubra]KJZ06713.1 hypothetical protein TW77_18070 [Pseudoalteromonas rubra]
MSGNVGYPLSSVQRAVLNDYIIGEKVPKYHIGCNVDCHFEFNEKDVLYAVKKVNALHPALRTCLVNNDGEYSQVVNDAHEAEFRFIDLSVEGQTSREHALKAAQKEFDEPYNLEQNCWRAIAVKYAENRFILCLGYHHLFVDGVSTAIVLEDIIALIGGNEVKPRSSLDYRSFIESDAKYLNSKRASRDREFWKEDFRTIPARVYKPKDKSLSKSFPSITNFSSISRNDVEQLRNHAESQGVGLAHSLFALVVAFIAKSKALNEVTIGIPVHNRTTAEHKKIVGMFSGLIPLKIEVPENDRFSDLVTRVARKLAKVYRYQKLPISEINSLLKTISYNRKHIFDVTISYEPFPSEHKCARGEYKASRVPEPYEQMPLAIAILDYHEKDDLQLMTNYNSNYFCNSEIGVVDRAIAAMVNRLKTSFDTKLSELPLQSERELEALAKGPAPIPSQFCHNTLTEQFHSVVELYGDSVAVECDRFVMTYEELNRRSTFLTNTLRERGIEQGDRVGFCLSRSCLSIVAILAIVKLGATYIPIDPATPDSRIEYLIADSGMKLIITEDAYEGKECLQTIPTLTISQLTTQSELSSQELVLNSLNASSPAYIIYTSGSTGKPKGVEVSHHNVLRLFDSCYSEFEFTQSDIWAVSHSLAFDFSVWEIWGALLFGGKMVLINEQQLRSPFDFYKIIADKNVTILSQTPSAFLSFDNTDAKQSSSLSLRRVVFGGEALTPSNLKSWFARHSDQHPKMINMYGTTETTVHATYKEISKYHATSSSESIIGKPLGDLDIQIQDIGGNILPVGSIGEMVIGGAGVSLGYYHKPELNQAKFYESENKTRYYRTGDLAKLLPNGEFEYIGRIDEQIKLRGYRIELGEIEAQISQLNGISNCVVQLREDVPEQKRIVAYLVCNSRNEETQKEYLANIKSSLQRTLPSYMVPTAFICLDHFPLTTNGKVDKLALLPPESYPNWQPANASYVPPNTELEIRISQLWADLLGKEANEIGRFDDFFILGGDSLMMMKLISQCNDEFNITLSFGDIFDNLELNQLSHKIERLVDKQAQTLSQLEAQVESLSEEEIDAMLESLS